MAIQSRDPIISAAELELRFLRMLVARLADRSCTYRSDRDMTAINRFNKAHPQDKTNVSVRDLAVNEFRELNPNLLIKE